MNNKKKKDVLRIILSVILMSFGMLMPLIMMMIDVDKGYDYSKLFDGKTMYDENDEVFIRVYSLDDSSLTKIGKKNCYFSKTDNYYQILCLNNYTVRKINRVKDVRLSGFSKPMPDNLKNLYNIYFDKADKWSEDTQAPIMYFEEKNISFLDIILDIIFDYENSFIFGAYWVIGTILFILGIIILVKGLKGLEEHKPKLYELEDSLTKLRSNLTQQQMQKLDKIISLIKEQTKIKSYEMIANISEKTDIFESKLGGLPYWDKKMNYPTDSKGNKLVLLMQVNFEKEKFDDERLPKEGILQIFISTNSVNGLNFDKKDEQKDWKVIYHKKINKNITFEDIEKLNIPTSSKLDINKEEYFPFYEEYALSFEEKYDYIGERNYNFHSILEKILNEEFGETMGGKNYGDYFTSEEQDYIYEYFNASGHKLFGYPAFTQTDPREFDEPYVKDYDTLLFQIDTDGGIMWGDSGVANFFINSKDLEKHDFSKILYNWDCF